MHTIYKPSHIGKEYSSYILFKLCPSWEYITDFARGKLYMNTNSIFSNMEKQKSLTNAQFDKFENRKQVLNSTEDIELVMDLSGKEPMILQGKRGTFKHNGIPIISASLGQDTPCNIYCLYSIWFNLADCKNTEVDKRILDGLGKYFAIILNAREFLNRVDRAAKEIPYKLKSDIKYNFVNYVNTENVPSIKLGPFIKSSIFDYQNEFRIALELDRAPEPLQYFEVGDLSDIVLIGETKHLLNVKIENNSIKIDNSYIPIIFEES